MNRVLIAYGSKHEATAGQRLGVRGQVVFGGRVPPDPSNFMERAMLKDTAEEDRDARDFDAVADWAAEIAAELAQ